METKKILISGAIFLAFFFPGLYAQSNSISDIQLKINTVKQVSLYYDIYLKDAFDDAKTYDTLPAYKKENPVSFVNAGDNTKIEDAEVKISSGTKLISFVVVFDKNINLDMLNKILSKETQTFISLSADLKLIMPEGKGPFILTKEIVKQLTLSTKSLTDEQKELMISDLNGNGLGIKNEFGISKEVNGKDSTQSEFILNFDVQKPFIADIAGSSFYYRLKGRVSTNAQNSLNTLEAYLLYNIKDHFYFEAGRIGPQKFDVNSLRANLGYETLIPNLIDLTGGKPRFRLKPDIKFGLAYQQNFQTDNPFNNKDGNLLLFASGYYYIPVLDKFAIITECEARYSDKFDTGDKFLFLYSLTLGYETPLSDLKVLLKVVNGKNEVNIGEATTYSLGLLLDFIPF